jgi:hypothetical protein
LPKEKWGQDISSKELKRLLNLLESCPALLALSIEERRVQIEDLTHFPVADYVKRQPVDAGGVPAEWITAPGAASFYIRGPQPEGWHLGQKQVPRFCTGTRWMVLPQTGQGSPPW